MNATGYNMFYDVGNHFNGTTSPASAVIDFVGENNVSIGDMFQRTSAYSTAYPRININAGVSIAFDAASQTQQGVYVRQTGVRGSLRDNTASQTILTFDAAVVRAVQINYTITRDTATRTGVYTVVASTDGTSGNLNGSDTGFQNVSPGVTFSVSETAGIVSWLATTSSTGSAATINYSVTRLA
jgi:hypothetical protein